ADRRLAQNTKTVIRRLTRLDAGSPVVARTAVRGKLRAPSPSPSKAIPRRVEGDVVRASEGGARRREIEAAEDRRVVGVAIDWDAIRRQWNPSSSRDIEKTRDGIERESGGGEPACVCVEQTAQWILASSGLIGHGIERLVERDGPGRATADRHVAIRLAEGA